MLKAAVTGPHRAELIECPQIHAKGEWALVKVRVSPMCTEYKGFVNGWVNDCLGHEAAGEVVEVAQEGRVNVGDRVVAMPLAGCGVCDLCLSGDYIHCQHAPDYAAVHGTRDGSGTYNQYLLKQDWLLMPIPDDLSYEEGALACCALGPSFGAFDLMQVDAFDTVLVTGAGPVGLGAIVNAKYRGARTLVVESIPWRVEKARELGADDVLDPRTDGLVEKLREMTGGRGVDKSLDCSGVVAAQRTCIDATRRKGHVAFVGENWSDSLPLRISDDMIRKGLTLHGSWHYNLALYPKLIEVIRRSPYAGKLVSHTLPMSDVQSAMELSASQQCAKVLLDPWR